MSFPIAILVSLLFGVGFGYCVQRAGLCFAHGLGEIFVGRGRRIMRLFCVIYVVTGLGFLASGWIDPALGLKTIGHIRGHGFYNLVGGMIFGAGVFLCGGCILGTLRQLGEGNLMFLIVLLAFIPGMALTVHVIDPALQAQYDVTKVLLPDVVGLSAPVVTAILVTLAIVGLWRATVRPRPLCSCSQGSEEKGAPEQESRENGAAV